MSSSFDATTISMVSTSTGNTPALKVQANNFRPADKTELHSRLLQEPDEHAFLNSADPKTASPGSISPSLPAASSRYIARAHADGSRCRNTLDTVNLMAYDYYEPGDQSDPPPATTRHSSPILPTLRQFSADTAPSWNTKKPASPHRKDRPRRTLLRSRLWGHVGPRYQSTASSSPESQYRQCLCQTTPIHHQQL